MILLNVLTLLNPKLPGYIKEKFSHKMGQDKRLMDFKSEILTKAKIYIQELETETLTAAAASISMGDDPQCNYMRPQQGNQPYRPRQNQFNRTFKSGQNQIQRKPPSQFQSNSQSLTSRPFCRLCHVKGLPRHVYTSHNLGEETCQTLSSRDKDHSSPRSFVESGRPW